MTSLGERLATAMKAARLNQPGLAKAASHGGHIVSQQVVQHLLSGRNITSKHLPALAEALGVSLDWLAMGRGAGPAPQLGPGQAQSDVRRRAPEAPIPDRLPVMGMAACGPDGWSLWNGDVVDTIVRPANLAGARNAYAVYAVGSSMEPRFFSGELVHIHPGKPVDVGCFVLVQLKADSEGETPKAVLKRLAKRSPSKVVLEQYNPPKKFEIRTDEIVSMDRVVGLSEG